MRRAAQGRRASRKTAGDEDRSQGLEAGANLFLSKPISPGKLISLLSETIG